MKKDISYVKDKLQWMREKEIWPNGLRYLWTDACGVVLLTSLYLETGKQKYLDEAEEVIADVYRVLGREKGIRIGEESDRYGQYYHYLAMWLYALYCIGQVKPKYREEAIELVKDIHPHFYVPGKGIYWKMKEDLSGPEPGYGYGALDAYHGYVVYKLLDMKRLEKEIAEMQGLIEKSYQHLTIDQDLGLGMMLWLTHFFSDENWAQHQKFESLEMLDELWKEDKGFFCRLPQYRETKFAFTNYGISIGLQAVGAHPERVDRLNEFFDHYESGDEYDTAAITHVMACNSHFPGMFLAEYG